MSRKTSPGAGAAALLTEAGYLDAMADLYDRLSSGELTRDETSALIGARRCLESFAAVRETREHKAQHKQLLKELKLTRAAMKVQASGATAFTSEQVQIPRIPSIGSTEN